MRQTSQYQLPSALLLLLVGALSCSIVRAEQSISTQGFKGTTSQAGNDELASAFNRADLGNSQARANSPLLAVPLSLARFMFPKSLGRGRYEGGEQAALMMGVSNKRSAQGSVASGGLDTLIGASGLGKRSVPSEYINIEPMFGGRPLAVLRGVAPQARIRTNGLSSSWEPTAMEMLEAANEM